MHKGNINLNSVNWVSSAKTKIKCLIRFRHGGKLVPGEVFKRNNNYILKLEERERAITPGQSAVFYKNNKCLGGGIVTKLGP